MQGHRASGHPGIVISAFVYHVSDPDELKPNHEVQEAFWFQLRWLVVSTGSIFVRRIAPKQHPCRTSRLAID